MLGFYLSRPAANVFGNLYPAYMSYKAIVSGRQEEYKQWLMFWTVNTVFTILEMFGDALVSWLPLYYEAKIGFLVWLAVFQGATIIYERYVGPVLDEYESDIDHKLDAVKDKAGEKLTELRKSSLAWVRSKGGEIAGLAGKMMAAAAEETRARTEGEETAPSEGAAGLKGRKASGLHKRAMTMPAVHSPDHPGESVSADDVTDLTEESKYE